MKKRCLLPLAALLLAALLTACAAGSAGGSTSAGRSDSFQVSAPGAVAEDWDMPSGDLSFDAAPEAPAEDNGGSQFYPGADAKLILRAEIRLQTTEFDAAEAALDALVSAQGGYYESASVQSGGYYDQYATRYGSYVVRVPKDRYEAFLSAAGEIGHVASLNRSSEDVGEAYFDSETRLRTQETKRDRLLELLEQADNMADIIQLESALSDVEYMIEMYSSDLRRYDSLIDYATITVSLDEVLRVSGGAGPAGSLGERMSDALSDGLNGASEAWENFLVWCAYHLVALIVVAAILVAAVLLLVRASRKKRTPPAPPSDPGGDQPQS